MGNHTCSVITQLVALTGVEKGATHGVSPALLSSQLRFLG